MTMNDDIGFQEPSLLKSLLIGVVMLCAAVLALVLKPQINAAKYTAQPSLEELVPKSFGEWRTMSGQFNAASLSVNREGQPSTDNPYDDILMRTYINDKNQRIILAVAWGKNQRQEIKIHRPELCYPAQGYDVRSLNNTNLDNINSLSGKNITGKQMTAFTMDGGEAVIYWIRIGNIYSGNAFQTRWHIISEGLQGRVPDGVLVRASMPIQNEAEAEQAWPVLQKFLGEMTGSLSAEGKNLISR